jgi:hypothetical protein
MHDLWLVFVQTGLYNAERHKIKLPCTKETLIYSEFWSAGARSRFHGGGLPPLSSINLREYTPAVKAAASRRTPY